jgi:hypothetical protein
MPKRPPIPPDHEHSPRRRTTRPGNAALPAGMPTRRKLRDLSRPGITATEEFASVLTEVKDSPDRSACIVVTSMLARVLEHVILARLMIVEKRRIVPLFERDGALSTFYGNIHLAFALKLISETVRDDLDVIRRVRNAFAHSILPLTFETEEISLEVKRLNHNSYYTLPSSESAEFELFHPHEIRREFMRCCHAIAQSLVRSITQFVDLQQAFFTAWQKTQRDA